MSDTLTVALVEPEACDVCAPKFVSRAIGETLRCCERHLDTVRRAIEAKRTTLAERIAPVMRPVPMRRFQDSDLVGHAEPAAPAPGKLVTALEVFLPEGGTVHVSLPGKQTVEDIVTALEYAIELARRTPGHVRRSGA